eukprot:m51a1_g6629 hypothetical protein (503) ;mRNA; r:66365-68065
MAGPLERTRAAHEEVERYQTAVVSLMKEQPRTHRETVYQGHVVRGFLDRICDCSNRAATLYDDRDGSRREELSSITGSGMTMFQLFYNKLREVKEYHRAADAEALPEQLGPSDAEYEPSVAFTGPERHGRCLDLASLHAQYQNLGTAFQNVDYPTYLDTFYRFDDTAGLPKIEPSRASAYFGYLSELREYLVLYFRRAKPLFDVDAKCGSLEAEAAQSWESAARAGISMGDILDAAQGAAKAEALARGELWCDACGRAYAKATVFEAHKTGKRHRAAEKAHGAHAEERKQISVLERVIGGLCEEVVDVIKNTKDEFNRKWARSANDVLADAEADGDEDDEIAADTQLPTIDDEMPKQTIDNYPVGWDGRPIPYWLYKLHGLGVEYKCEICGDMSYWGRRAFEKHFQASLIAPPPSAPPLTLCATLQEFRHTNAMATLGIVNSVHFFDVTKIADAVALWQKMQADKATKTWRPDDEEEHEDAEGNVYSKKLYEALVKQGIIQK